MFCVGIKSRHAFLSVSYSQQREPSTMDGNIFENVSLSLASTAKEEGNKFFRAREFDKAIKKYDEAIEIGENGMLGKPVAIYYANRSAAKYQLKDYQGAEKDADGAINRDPTYAKGHLKKVEALEALQKFKEANEAMVAGCFSVKPEDHSLMEKKSTEFTERCMGQLKPVNKDTQKVVSFTTRDICALMDRLEHDLRTVQGWKTTGRITRKCAKKSNIFTCLKRLNTFFTWLNFSS